MTQETLQALTDAILGKNTNDAADTLLKRGMYYYKEFSSPPPSDLEEGEDSHRLYLAERFQHAANCAGDFRRLSDAGMADNEITRMLIKVLMYTFRWEEAAEICRRAFNMAMNDEEIHIAAGYCAFYAKDFSKSVVEFEKAFSFREADGNYIEALVDSLCFTKRFGKAMRFIDRIIAANPRNIKFLHRKAMCLKEMGKYDEAIRMLDHIISLHPEMVDTYYHDRGTVLQAKGDLDAALNAYTYALELNGFSLASKAEVVEILHQQGKFVEAVAAADRYSAEIACTPANGVLEHDDIRRNKIDILCKAFDFAGAAREYETLCVKDDFIEHLLNVGLRRTQGLQPLPLHSLQTFYKLEGEVAQLVEQDPYQRQNAGRNLLPLFETINRATLGQNPIVLDLGAFFFYTVFDDSNAGHNYAQTALKMTPYLRYSPFIAWEIEIANTDNLGDFLRATENLIQYVGMNFQAGMVDRDLGLFLTMLLNVNDAVKNARAPKAQAALRNLSAVLDLNRCVFFSDENKEKVEMRYAQWTAGI